MRGRARDEMERGGMEREHEGPMGRKGGDREENGREKRERERDSEKERARESERE